MASGAAIRIAKVSRSYGDDVRAVDDVSLEIGAGEFLTMLGPSGSGKTTTLMMVAGFEQPDAGEIIVGDQPITRLPPHRRNIGMVFQSYALFPHLNVFDNVAYPLRVRKRRHPEIRKRVAAALDSVKLAGFEGRYPNELSGGQQQRVALARALVFEPPVLLLDEPLGALDKRLREHMQLEIKALHESLGITMIYVTHDQTEALVMSDRIAVMNYGRIEQVGTPAEVYERPTSRFVAEFIGESNELPATVDARRDGATTLGGSRFAASDLERFDAGEAVWLVIRPEKLLIGTTREEDVNSLRGTVKDVNFYGSTRRYTVRVDGEECDLTVIAQNSRLVKTFAPGETVYVSFDREDCRAVPTGLSVV